MVQKPKTAQWRKCDATTGFVRFFGSRGLSLADGDVKADVVWRSARANREYPELKRGS